ncbi:DEAD/DEAH box helicase family protein [Photobacterium galatheae]|uniref:DEAD/DEAH box helicase n=1 Tax=Photobacterium galatheae TaxID=1654360 RepID=A0A066RWU7_9GAMM|nr:DEAD/DEAH box helicase family protein [Photobacterium galatheae]KDM91868.1 DEAD/DEAH box helicase [Photobacterium galatheae]MCM0147719.1 DEAD/DEAH box helicase family protein [Photobacterium galatheae]
MTTTTSLNFEMLRHKWPEVADLGALAERYVYNDPETSLVKQRNMIELIVRWLYREERLPQGYRPNLFDLIKGDAFTSVIPAAVVEKLDILRQYGNKAAHGEKCHRKQSVWLLQECWLISSWLYVRYDNGNQSECGVFQTPPVEAVDTSADALKKKQQELDKALHELKVAEEKQISILRELQFEKEKADEFKARLEQARQKNEQAVNLLDMNEAETRSRLIDARLRDANWDVSEDGSNTAEVSQEEATLEQPTKTGNGRADYVLWDDCHKPLAVIEAKSTQVDAEMGRYQAKLYADWLEKEYGQRPVIFYTNGYDIYIWDDHPAHGYPPRRLFGFYSKESLQHLIQQRATKKDLLATPIDTAIAGGGTRLYQLESIRRVAETFSNKKRGALIVQATGTGKTRVSIAMTKMLLDARWVKRVLFLCDRKELRKQARNAFNEFINDPICVVGSSDKETQKTARVFIATYPGMMNIMEKFDVGYFDLIVADESHRSIYNIYGDLFKYYDSLQVGLTATPVEMVSRSTCQLFKCEYKMPTAEYSLEKAIEDDHLVPYEVVAHTTKFLREGIHKENLTDEQIAQLEDDGIDPNTLDFDAKAINKQIYNKPTNAAIIRNLMENGIKDKDGQLPGKSIVFARNHKHAMLLQEVFNEQYPQFAGKFCQVIDNYDPRAEQLIDDFKGEGTNHELTIAISVDMLDTGIDVPEVVNLVFAKPLKSKVKFWQMIGRGTRLCKDLFGSGKDKEKFRIFDHWGVFEYFEQEPPEFEPNVVKSLAQKRFECWIELGKFAQKRFAKDALEKVTLLLRSQMDALNERSISVQEKWKEKARLSDAKLLRQFSPKTQQDLEDAMAPLMQWVDVRGQGDAMRFDMDIIEAQKALYDNPENLLKAYHVVSDKVGKLPPYLGQVQQHGELINQLRDQSWWLDVTFEQLEHARITLRDIMHLMGKELAEPPRPPVYTNIAEDEAEYRTEIRSTNLKSVDFKLYRKQVQGALEPLFETNPVLVKIRKGEPVTDVEIDELRKLVIVQNPNIDIKVLKDFYPQATAGLDKILRTLVGMDSQAVAERFTDFAAEHHLNSTQMRFLDLLKNHIRDFGTVEMKQLFEQPFTAINSDGVTGVFPNMEQVVALKNIVDSLTVQTGKSAL